MHAEDGRVRHRMAKFAMVSFHQIAPDIVALSVLRI